MSTEIKICGLSNLETLDAALDAGADHVGFVFFEASPRNVSLEQGAALVRHAQGSARTVALVVNPSAEHLDDIMREVQPETVQFHGSESLAEIEDFRRRYPETEIWKAIPVERPDDLELLAIYLTATDRILFDAKAPKDADRPGGHGQVFDWDLLRNLDPQLGFMLSGGLNPDNVAEALRLTHASAVDVSSGVESAPGVKDVDKIRAFIQAVRAVQKDQVSA